MLELGQGFKQGSKQNAQTQWAVNPIGLHPAVAMATGGTMPEDET